MSDADIIATLYFDTMNIYRREKVKDPNTGVSTLKDVLKYSNIQCCLDKSNLAVATGETGTSSLVETYTLFCRPTVDIQAGDILEIRYHGRVETFEAGDPYPYKSHIETTLSKKVRI